jgi:hypothetical protein
MANEKAILGIISYTGKTWTVEFKKKGMSTSYKQGYGEFPFDEYPDIPVIDYTDNDAVMDKLAVNLCCEETSNNGSGVPGLWTRLPLTQYLQWHRDHGISVIENYYTK